MTCERAENRKLYRISGADREAFLQGLVTNDMARLKDGIVYAALLTPQGKYLADFFLTREDGAILLDCDADQAEDLVRRLTMYKLRADVGISPSGLQVSRGLGDPPGGALPDPRHPALGWRLYSDAEGEQPQIDWGAIRVAHCIPAAGVELIPGETYILEAGFDRINGVDFRKGCYVGQEVTARMRHKTELKKGLVTVAVDHPVPVGTPIEAGGKSAGILYTQANGRGIAWLRFDRIGETMTAGTARVIVTQP